MGAAAAAGAKSEARSPTGCPTAPAAALSPARAGTGAGRRSSVSTPPAPLRSDRTGLSLAVLSAATWSLAGVWVRLLPGVPLATIVAGRLAFALVALAPVIWLRRRALGRADAPAWALAALMAGYYVAAVAAFRLAPVAEATLFVNASPLFAVGWALARREPLSRAQLAGTALALAGVVVIVLPGLLSSADADRQRLVGDALALGRRGRHGGLRRRVPAAGQPGAVAAAW